MNGNMKKISIIKKLKSSSEKYNFIWQYICKTTVLANSDNSKINEIFKLFSVYSFRKPQIVLRPFHLQKTASRNTSGFHRNIQGSRILLFQFCLSRTSRTATLSMCIINNSLCFRARLFMAEENFCDRKHASAVGNLLCLRPQLAFGLFGIQNIII